MSDLAELDPPNCPSCLNRCTPAGTVRHPFWLCPFCKTAVLAR
ncbi:hypothetical protein [Cryobacterium sp. 5I3]|nr:hypothetical protein [Cryobacterium sp. 5I3]